MKAQPLPSLEQVRSLFNYDPSTGKFTRLVATGSRAQKGAIAGSLARNGYIEISINGRRYMAHRLAWLYVTGEDPGELEIDHINRNRSDNRFINLRIASSQINKINCGMRRHNTSGFRGVTWVKARQKWKAFINNNGRQIFLGHFDNIEDAGQAYDEAALQLHGQYATTNTMLQKAS